MNPIPTSILFVALLVHPLPYTPTSLRPSSALCVCLAGRLNGGKSYRQSTVQL